MFTADYWSVPHPSVLRALGAVGENWERGPYGGDKLTRSAQDALREKFGLGSDAGIFFVPTGTAGNLLATATLIPHSWQALMCVQGAHMVKYEAGGPESRGHTVIQLPERSGKVFLSRAYDMVDARRPDTHQSCPAMLAVANATELGTFYTDSELEGIGKFAASRKVRLHMDGSRLAYVIGKNFFASRLPKIFAECGFSTLMLGFTKVGALGVDVLVVADPELAGDASRYHKQLGYTGARMQGSAAQVLAMLKDDIWLQNAAYANEKALYLRDRLSRVLGLQAVYPVETNAVFVGVQRKVADALKQGGWAYIWSEPWEDNQCIVRFMTSWATTEAHIDQLIDFLLEQQRK